MTEIINLADRIEKQLPVELVKFMKLAGGVAASQGQSLYLIGGVVRDLLLGRATFDLDLVVDGDAITLAHRLTPLELGKIITHPRFGTAKLQWHKWSIDFAAARSETYAKPGALPTVQPASINDDLIRRDFTINAMAVYLAPDHYGELIDLHGGRDDLEHRFIRILHERSFIDDATRIWRALRYEQRFDFRLETSTLKLLKRDIAMLDTISGDRIRYELECILREERPEKVLRRADELGVLPKLHPALKGDGWLAEKFEQARQQTSPKPLPMAVYLALMAYHLTGEQSEELILRLRLPRSLSQSVRDTIVLKVELDSLADLDLNPSRVYHTLHPYSPPAITANLIATDSPPARQHLQLFLSRLRYVKPALTGDDLIRMGIPQGPQIREILDRLHEARLDGKVSSKQEEEALVKGWVDKRR